MNPVRRLLPLLTLALAGCWDAPDQTASAKAEPAQAQAPAPPPPVAAAPDAPAANGATARLTALAPAALDAALDLPASGIETVPAAPFPDEVTAFMVDRDGCDHFRGEEPYDEERRAYLDQSIAELCTGTDATLAALRRRYATDAAVIAALKGYEDRIEAPGMERTERAARDVLF